MLEMHMTVGLLLFSVPFTQEIVKNKNLKKINLNCISYIFTKFIMFNI